MARLYEVIKLQGSERVTLAEYGKLIAPQLPEGLCPKAHKVVPARDPEWRKRADCQLREAVLWNDTFTRYEFPFPLDPACPTGEHEPFWRAPEWDLAPIADHFAHVIKKDGARLIEFYASEAHGEIDKRTPMTAGRYAQRYYPGLTSDQVRDYASAIDKADEFKVAVTADEIIEVYVNGPDSCMSKAARNYDGHAHPVSVYGESDLQLAYLGEPEDATARALIWPERKVYVRIYGDEWRMKNALNDAGYVSGSVRGAKIRKIENENGSGFIMPYLDGCSTVASLNHEWFTIGGGEFDAQQTNGLCGDEQMTCENCDGRTNEDEYSIVYTATRNGRPYVSETWCENCASSRTFYCEATEETYSRSGVNRVHLADGRTVTEAWAENNASYCQGSDEWTTDETVEIEDLGETWSLDHARENGWKHPDTGFWYSEPQPDEDGFIPGRIEDPRQIELTL